MQYQPLVSRSNSKEFIHIFRYQTLHAFWRKHHLLQMSNAFLRKRLHKVRTLNNCVRYFKSQYWDFISLCGYSRNKTTAEAQIRHATTKCIQNFYCLSKPSSTCSAQKRTDFWNLWCKNIQIKSTFWPEGDKLYFLEKLMAVHQRSHVHNNMQKASSVTSLQEQW